MVAGDAHLPFFECLRIYILPPVDSAHDFPLPCIRAEREGARERAAHIRYTSEESTPQLRQFCVQTIEIRRREVKYLCDPPSCWAGGLPIMADIDSIDTPSSLGTARSTAIKLRVTSLRCLNHTCVFFVYVVPLFYPQFHVSIEEVASSFVCTCV